MPMTKHVFIINFNFYSIAVIWLTRCASAVIAQLFVVSAPFPCKMVKWYYATKCPLASACTVKSFSRAACKGSSFNEAKAALVQHLVCSSFHILEHSKAVEVAATAEYVEWDEGVEQIVEEPTPPLTQSKEVKNVVLSPKQKPVPTKRQKFAKECAVHARELADKLEERSEMPN